MFLRQLTYLIALDRCRHFSRAAESCGVSQPALSAGIRQLEAELGITIIQRNRRFYGLTPEGERVLGWARQTLAALDGLRQEAAFAQNIAGGSVSVGTMPPALLTVSALLEHFRSVVPALHADVRVYSSGEIIHHLREHTLQIGLMYLDQVPQDGLYESHFLFAEKHVFVCSSFVQAPEKENISWQEMQAVPLCLLGQNMRSRQLIDKGFRQAGVVADVRLETDALELLHAELFRGRLASILPVAALPERAEERGLQIRQIEDMSCPDVGAVRLSQGQHTALSEYLWERVQTFKFAP